MSTRLRSPSSPTSVAPKKRALQPVSESVRKLRQRGSDSVRVGADVTKAQSPRGAAPSVSETSQVQRSVDAVAAPTGQRAAAVTVAQNLTPVSAAQAAPVQKQAVPAVISEPPTPQTTAPDVVSGVLTAVGVSPLSGNGPGAPVESPASVALFAGWRRLSEQGLTDQTKSVRSQPVLTSQSEDGYGLAFAAETAALMSAPAVPTVGAPNLVTGTVSGSLNGYTVTGELASGKVAVDGVSEVGSKIIVRNWAELDAALGAANAGSTIHMRAGGYVATHALVIPEGVALEGEGRMLTNRDGLPIGFAPKTLTTLRATAAVQGDFITMLDGSTLRNIQIIDTEQARPLSNVVAIVSQHPFDSIEAYIIACEIQNYGVSGVGPNGPTGRAVLIVNRTLQAPPPVAMHEGSSLDVRITRSLIRSFNNGSGVFAINFAANSSITLELSHNYIGGGLDVAGGVSRPLEVSNSVTAIRSHHNLYRSDHGEGAAPAATGWSLLGGTGPPPPLPIPSTHDNTLLLTSSHDRIEGFRTAINASAARRAQPTAGPSNNNTLVLELTNARLSSIDADIRISAAETLNPSLTPGDNNVTIFRAHNVIGSGPRQNYFGHARFSPPVGQPSDLDASLAGNGNRLEITGTAVKFERHNRNIEPGPDLSSSPAGVPRCPMRAVVGVSPLSGNGPGAPVALFAGWRRLSEQGSTDEASIARSQPVLTSQTEDESGLAFASATAALSREQAAQTYGSDTDMYTARVSDGQSLVDVRVTLAIAPADLTSTEPWYPRAVW